MTWVNWSLQMKYLDVGGILYQFHLENSVCFKAALGSGEFRSSWRWGRKQLSGRGVTPESGDISHGLRGHSFPLTPGTSPNPPGQVGGKSTQRWPHETGRLPPGGTRSHGPSGGGGFWSSKTTTLIRLIWSLHVSDQFYQTGNRKSWMRPRLQPAAQPIRSLQP